MVERNSECCNPNEVVSDFYDKILGYVIKRVNDIEIAKDITQEVMGRMIDAYKKDTPITNVRAWMFQVARNIIADRYRKKEIIEYKENHEERESESDDVDTISAEDFIIPMIKLLPEKYSTPLYMSDIENLKQTEIAKKLDISLSAVKMRCQRGRKKLHELFFECCDITYSADGSFDHCTIKSSCKALKKEEKTLNQITIVRK